MRIRANMILLFLIMAFCSCKSRLQRLSEKGVLITKSQYGRNWPFKLDSLYLFCGDKKETDIYVAHKGTIYAINGKASDMADSEEIDAGRPWDILLRNADSKQLHTWVMIQELAVREYNNGTEVKSE